MKKIIAIFLAALMVMSLTVTAFAVDNQKPDLTGHTYTAYQIFGGYQVSDSSDLYGIEWGTGISPVGFLAALKSSAVFENEFKNCETAEDVAEVIASWNNDSPKANAFAVIAENYVTGDGEAVAQGSILEAGYYLVVDTTPGVADEERNLSLVQLTKKGAFEIRNKVEVPQVDKTLTDKNNLSCTNTDPDHIHNKDCYNWVESNNVAIGDAVNFRIETKVPSDAATYNYYFFIIEDTMSKGLTFDQDSLKVTINGKEAVEGTDFNVRYGMQGKTFQIALIDAVSHANQDVVVTYDGILNEDAIVGVVGNPNVVDVKYSDDHTIDYKGWNDDDNPGFPKDDTRYPLSETPEDITLTFVSEIRIYKVDENGKTLTGAEFTLTGNGLNIVLVKSEKFVESDDGMYYALKDGSYTIEDPITEDFMEVSSGNEGYVLDNDYTKDDAIVIGGNTYRPFVPAEDQGMTVYVLVHSNAHLYVAEADGSFVAKYAKVTELKETKTAVKANVSAMVDENGVVVFTGLNAGEYTLTETVAPAGYNAMEPINFTISCTTPSVVITGEEKATWSTNTSSIAYNAADDAFEVTVVNYKGNTLPETGGMGTTIFYVLGGIMVCAAVVLLITKKRMSFEA